MQCNEPILEESTEQPGCYRHAYSPGSRYLCGEPIRQECCLDVLKTGQQRQRRAAALELALLDPGQPLFNTSATARRQMRLRGLR